MVPTLSFATQQARAFEHAQVLGHRGQRHRERLREFGDGRGALRELRDDAATCGICERREHGVELRVCPRLCSNVLT